MTGSGRESNSKIVESYLAYTGFPQTGRRYIFPEITRQDGWRMRADAIEKLPGLFVTPVHSRLRMQEQANQTANVDLQRALDGAPWWGETLSFDGALKVERRWLIAGFDRASAI